MMEKVILLLGLEVLVTSFVSSQSTKGPCDRFKLVTRKEWRSRPAPHLLPMYNPVSKVIIIHTASNASNCKNPVACVRTVQAIQTYAIEDDGYFDISYNFLIGGDGRVYEGTGWVIAGAHTIGFNRIAVGVAFIGNYMTVAPKQDMLDAAKNLIACGIEQGMLSPITKVHGHRDVTCTDSPGDKLYEIIRKWNNYIGGLISGYTCPSLLE